MFFILKKWIVGLFFISITSFSATVGYIPSESKLSTIDHKYYSLGYLEAFEQPAWTYYQYKKNYLNGRHDRSNVFLEDTAVLTDSAKPEDYKYSGFDRGHMVPAGDMKISERSMQESFFMSNVSPQRPDFNRGIWKKLEREIRRWVSAKGDLHIFTGPIFSKKPSFLRGTSIAIPKAFYKIVVQERKGRYYVAAFIFPNEGSNQRLKKFMRTVDSIEQATGIDFLSTLPDRIENKVESEIQASYWF